MADKPKDPKDIRELKLDEAFERHRSIVEEAKKEYDQYYKELIDNLSPSHLDPIAKILRERDGTVLDTEKSMQSIKHVFQNSLIEPWNFAWQEHLAPNVTKLEMLKEYFKEFEGTNWNMHNMSVEERTLPLRIEFKKKRLHWLQKQVEHQRKILEPKIEETIQRRLLMQHITEESLKLCEQIKNQPNSDERNELKKELYKLLYRDCEYDCNDNI